MATSDKLPSRALAALPSNAAIWSGRKLASPKPIKVKRKPRKRGKRK